MASKPFRTDSADGPGWDAGSAFVAGQARGCGQLPDRGAPITDHETLDSVTNESSCCARTWRPPGQSSGSRGTREDAGPGDS